MQARAPLWRTALVTASSAIRYAATSTAAGSGSTSSSASTVHTSVVVAGRQLVLGGPLPQRRDQSELVERGGAQAVDQAAYLGDLVAGEVGEPADHLGRLGRIGGDQVLGGLQPHGHRGQRRAEAVVEVAAQPAALLLARGDQLLAGAHQLAVGQHRLDERADLGADVLEQEAVAAAERRRGRAPASRCSEPSRVPPATRSTVTGVPSAARRPRRRSGSSPSAAGTSMAA